MPAPLFLGLDIGTSSLKALIATADGVPISHASVEYPLSTPRPEWSEQDPDDWVRAAHQATRAALAAAVRDGHADAAHRIAGIGFSGQMHGATLVDRTNTPLRPCILWNDARSADECERLDRDIGRETILARTGNRMLAGFTAPKVRWVQRHEPSVWSATDCVLLPKDYVRLKLGSVRATDAADASGTLYFDVARRAWSMDMLRDLGMNASQVPACHESPDPVDRLSDSAASLMGLTAGIPLVAGAGDQAANAIGSGIISPGAVAASLGTSGVIFAASDSFRASPDGALHAFCHALPGRWHLMSVMLSAAGSMRWYLDTLARDTTARANAEGLSVYELLDREAAAIQPGCEGLRFVPTLSGERCPIPNPHARGGFHGISVAHTQAHFTRAVMEGVACGMGLCMGLIRQAGITPPEVIASGGGFESPLWTAMHANAFGIPVRRAETPDSAALGAAILAAIGTENRAKTSDLLSPSTGGSDPIYPTQLHVWKNLMADQELLQRSAL
ncbi:MAG: xylulokinase [Planctomycetota bacterium]|nr:xylulokinase [Planctomycetota bacterium]